MLVFWVAWGRVVFSTKEIKWFGVPIIMLTASLLLTYTRQAWLGSVMGFFFLLLTRKKSLLWFLPVALGVFYLITPAHINVRINSMVNFKDNNLQTRIALWQGGWLVFKDHPLTGCGFKCIDVVNKDYPDPTGYINKLRGMHNNFVQLAVDTGLFGLISWVSIWVAYFMTLFRRIVSMGENLAYKRDAMASAAAITGFLVAGFFETNFYDAEVSMLMYFIMALPFAANGKSPAASEKRNPETISQHI
ncbi:MAG: O-antigen ligase family protein [Nitrospinae bacterium]|nr:O-antigen ligase family protein [Nitrospinota bacterium]